MLLGCCKEKDYLAGGSQTRLLNIWTSLNYLVS